jgi:hypothetical protein
LHILFVWIASLQLHTDHNGRPAELEVLYNKAMQFWIIGKPSATIVTGRKIICTIMSQPRLIPVTTGRKMAEITTNRADISAQRSGNTPQNLTL